MMKTFGPALSLVALLLAAVPARAQMPDAGGHVQSLRALQTQLPIYPQEVLQLGIREGDARIAISVDKTGQIDDILAVAYSHPAFARSAVNAIRRWKFEPARYDGEPTAAATEVEIKYAVEGTIVVTLTPVETLTLRMYEMFNGNPDASWPRTLRELDRIPTPIAAPSPGYPVRFAHPGAHGSVTVSFFIDQNGAVRLPSVSAAADPDLAAAAIDALRKWKFEPPTCKGRAVLVRASQQFNFRAPPAKTAVTNG